MLFNLLNGYVPAFNGILTISRESPEGEFVKTYL
jgi:hypothetical protein